MKFKLEDRFKGIQSELTVSSMITWYDFQQKVTQKLNIFLSTLHLQYRFSNENKSSLPFDLNSHASFGSMHDKLEPLVVQPLLKNGKRSTCKMKIVTVKLFNKGVEGETEVCSSGKHLKVSLLCMLWVAVS